MIKIGALWKPKKEGSKFILSGTLGDANLFVFKNNFKDKETQPDYNLYVAEKKKKEPDNVPPIVPKDDCYGGNVPPIIPKADNLFQ